MAPKNSIASTDEVMYLLAYIYLKSYQWILTKFSGNVSIWTRNRGFNFAADQAPIQEFLKNFFIITLISNIKVLGLHGGMFCHSEFVTTIFNLDHIWNSFK